MINNIGWLMTTPARDYNFKCALERATDEEIKETISRLAGKDGVKTKITALERDFRKRKKSQEGKDKGNGEINKEV